MMYERRYLQFNDLIFDGYDMISDYDGEVSFKGSSIEYSYGHGSYRPFKRKYLFVAEREVSMTLTLNMLKIPCEDRPYYARFALEELAKVGKLWSIRNGELMWAVAAVTEISENFSHRSDKLVYNINFVIPGGIWYKADKQKTFLLPWNVCTFMECKEYQVYQPCKESIEDCCASCLEKTEQTVDCSCCCNDQLTEDMALCYHLDELNDFYGCFTPYRIVYDCEAAERFLKDDYFGQKFCNEDLCNNSTIAGRFYSETEIPTEDVTIIIKGAFKNPWIKINGNTNIIEYENDDPDGTLIIEPSGDVYFKASECCDPVLQDMTIWTIPEGNTYGWTVESGFNSLVINLNNCCNGKACVWIQHDPIAL